MKLSNSALALSFALALASPALHADPTAADKATARDLFTEGKALRAKGDHHAALAKFEGAYALLQSPITGLELARERVAVGQLIEARELLLDVSRMPPKLNESPEAAKARTDATALASDLKPRIPSFTVKLVTKLSSASVAVTVDGAVVPAGTLAAPRRANPGKHVIVARATGASDRTIEVELAEGESREVEVKIDVEPAPAPSPPVVVTSPPPATVTTTDEPHRGRYQRIAGIGVGALGVIGVGAGVILGLSANSTWDRSAANCPNDLCDPEGARLADDARSLGRTSRIVLGVGAVAVAAGVVLYLTAPSNKSAATVSISPTGLTLRASF